MAASPTTGSEGSTLHDGAGNVAPSHAKPQEQQQQQYVTPALDTRALQEKGLTDTAQERIGVSLALGSEPEESAEGVLEAMGHRTPNLLLNRMHRTDLVLHAGLWLGDILHVARPADLLQVAPANSAPPATIALIFT